MLQINYGLEEVMPDNWIEAYDLADNQNDADGTYKLSTSIELSDLLRTALPHQNYSTSFQARWGQFGNFSAAIIMRTMDIRLMIYNCMK